MAEKEAVIVNNEIRCPICNRMHGKLQGNEVIKGFRIFCRGRYANDRHFFILNYNADKEV